ncbi:pyridoxal-phosphate dependent enzyme [Nocardioides sp.]|uniref:pyridoxal-phosphate dependent enzyme n=1 Tax=Nocardioides sp. TaxID=35761 RepID=UPI00260C8E93|nr:pyridoxal-phosphate dependent enzyme [Nocardioides sp.]
MPQFDTPVHDGVLTTPLIRLDRLWEPPAPQVWAKLENLQLSGSIKERSAASMLDGLVASGRLRPGAVVVASTSGNLGVGLARQCTVRGFALIAVVDELTNVATRRSMEAFGARIDVVAPPVGGNRLAARIARVATLVRQIPEAVEIDQYANPDNPAAHAKTTLPELVAQLGRVPTDLYVATSTAGTLLGCQDALAAHGWGTRLVAVDAVGSALFGGTPGERTLPGVGAGVESAHARRAHPDDVRRIDEADMVRGARALARREGLLAGASTGAVIAAIEADLPRLGPDRLVAMLVHDGGMPYLDTLYDDDWVLREIADPERALGRSSGGSDIDEPTPRAVGW